MKPSTTSRNFKSFAVRTLAVLFWLGVWQLVSYIVGQEILLVSPVRAVLALFRLMGQASFYQSILSSFGRILAGFLLASFLGALLAALAGWKRAVRILLEPLMHAVRATPVASFVIVALIFIRSRYLSIFISFLMVLPVIYTNILAGIDATDPKMLELARLFRLSPLKTITSIYLDSVYPHFIAACTLSLGMCWKSGIAAEVIGLPSRSIGEALYQAKLFFNTPELFAWTIAIILLSVGFEKLIMTLTKRLSAGLGLGGTAHADRH